ncbi:hypothetical protein BABINDRAFT_169567 [Babjeviella inositovora NRRL Y-12698]|uniref:Uncharacterized protein n=1 Tax=Babjeviella inositovora NRRL Y-12698 TaxID=984486 RepID=A0A1E3QIR1_9ASCO|nr:uncharacterized protein BABINDRAFT_169567 [Babjeviella inositovora NRRL Y-12698]ODQ76952.1 hypothetical protein BABINDRAFT_169567 [Babjeviella inositovora NRRL Y-12698]
MKLSTAFLTTLLASSVCVTSSPLAVPDAADLVGDIDSLNAALALLKNYEATHLQKRDAVVEKRAPSLLNNSFTQSIINSIITSLKNSGLITSTIQYILSDPTLKADTLTIVTELLQAGVLSPAEVAALASNLT